MSRCFCAFAYSRPARLRRLGGGSRATSGSRGWSRAAAAQRSPRCIGAITRRCTLLPLVAGQRGGRTRCVAEHDGARVLRFAARSARLRAEAVVFRIAHNESISLIRRRRLHQPLDAAATVGDDSLAASVQGREDLRQLRAGPRRARRAPAGRARAARAQRVEPLGDRDRARRDARGGEAVDLRGAQLAARVGEGSCDGV